MSSPSDPVAAARSLSASLDAMAAELAAVAEQGQKTAERERDTRKIAWGLVVSMALDLILTIALAAIAVQAHDASSRAASASASNLALCQAGNTSRGQQHGLWLYLINLSPPKTAESKLLIGKFEQHLSVVFAPRDCQKLNNAGH